MYLATICAGKNNSCETRQAHLWLKASSVGSSRISFAQGGTAIDALTIATGITLRNKDTGATRKTDVKVGKIITLTCTPLPGSKEFFATRVFSWTVRGEASRCPRSCPAKANCRSLARRPVQWPLPAHLENALMQRLFKWIRNHFTADPVKVVQINFTCVQFDRQFQPRADRRRRNL